MRTLLIIMVMMEMGFLSSQHDLVEFWKSKDLSLKLKVNRAKSLVWSITLLCSAVKAGRWERMKKEWSDPSFWIMVVETNSESELETKENEWVGKENHQSARQKKEGFLEMIKKKKKKKLNKYEDWKRRGVWTVWFWELLRVRSVTRRRSEWVDNNRSWRNGMENARRMDIKWNTYSLIQGLKHTEPEPAHSPLVEKKATQSYGILAHNINKA